MTGPLKPNRLSEWLGFVVLAVVLAFTLAVSWRKWPDPVIDFGRELYLPWRISEGAVLYRDLDANYGPLSHYFHALIFRLVGPGMMHLVFVNLTLYAAILALIYYEVRLGWGRIAALGASLFFIVGFSFSQFVSIGNYNFATPYSHETTHGFFLVLVLIGLGTSWLRRETRSKAFVIGLCGGLCALLKIEVAFAAGLVTLGILVRGWITKPGFRQPKAWLPFVISAGVGACAPPLMATAVLWKTGGFSPGEAFLWANSGWLALFIYRGIASDPLTASMLGITGLAQNLRTLFVAGISSLVIATVVARLCQRMPRRGALIALGIVLILAAVFGAPKLAWTSVALVFPVWLCFAAFFSSRQWSPSSGSSRDAANLRWLMWLAAVAFLARMIFNPRIYHYGYYQAALAGVVTVATAFNALPHLLKLPEEAHRVYTAVLSTVLALGLWNLHLNSRKLLDLKTMPVGEGADLFYAFPPQVFPAALLVEETRKNLAARPDCRKLLVVPEGIMLNYLLRKPSTISAYTFNPYWLNWRERIVGGLTANPPDYVVLISRDLREYGVQRFGESPEHGATLLSWISQNYQPVEQIGANPLEPGHHGTMILRRSR